MKIRCLKCNDIIESLSVHDYKKCKCGACSIDGGNEYTRNQYMDPYLYHQMNYPHYPNYDHYQMN